MAITKPTQATSPRQRDAAGITSIYTVSTVGYFWARRPFCCRGWGFYGTRERAVAGLMNCCSDEAGLYNYAVIEHLAEGIVPFGGQELWFKWAGSKKRWVSCKKPRGLNGMVNFALG